MKLSSTQSKVLAVSLLLLLIAFIIGAVAIPTLLLHRHYDEVTDDLLSRLKKYHQIVSQTSAIQVELARVAAQNPGKYFLKSTTEALSTSEMQEFVKTIIESKGGKVASIQPIPSKVEGNHRRIGVSVQANGSITAIQHSLYAIETREPYLFVESVVVRAGQGRLYRPLPSVQPEFGLQMNVYGYAVIKK